MHYSPTASLSHLRPVLRRQRAFVRHPGSGFGSLLDANIATKAYYIPLVEVFDDKLGLRKYGWGETRYLSNWEALGYAQSLHKMTKTGHQTCTLYEWTNNSWRKSAIPRF